MRIIGGLARGRRLFAPKGQETRPTADRNRESLFNILASHVPDARVLDLFGGSGALGLEALSRGARSVVIVDRSADAIRAITRNAEAVAGAAYREQVNILACDYRKAVPALAKGEPFDLVFLDPPYGMTEAYADATERLWAAGLITTETQVVYECARAAEVGVPKGFVVRDERIYRDTVLRFLIREAEV